MNIKRTFFIALATINVAAIASDSNDGSSSSSSSSTPPPAVYGGTVHFSQHSWIKFNGINKRYPATDANLKKLVGATYGQPNTEALTIEYTGNLSRLSTLQFTTPALVALDVPRQLATEESHSVAQLFNPNAKPDLDKKLSGGKLNPDGESSNGKKGDTSVQHRSRRGRDLFMFGLGAATVATYVGLPLLLAKYNTYKASVVKQK